LGFFARPVEAANPIKKHSIGCAKRGRYNPAGINCVKPILGEMNMAGSVRLLGPRGIGTWVVPAVTACGYGSRAREIAGWTGHYRS